MDAYPFCICTVVSERGLQSLIESGGRGCYRDEHPWLIAREHKDSADRAGQCLPLVIATGHPLALSHWAVVRSIDVIELHRGLWETACEMGELEAVNPIWSSLDSLLLKPGDDQLRREALEPIRQHRQPLDERHVRPYAICETPAFIVVSVRDLERTGVTRDD